MKYIEKTVSVPHHKNYKVKMEYYDSAAEVVKAIKSRPITNCKFKNLSIQDNFDDCGRGWRGVDTYEEALNLLKNGYSEVVDAMKTEIKLKGNGEVKRIAFQNSLVGFAPVVPLALQGVPNNMVNMTMKPIKAKVLDIYYSMTCNASTEPKEFIDNGKKLLSAIIALEKRGYKFNLYAVQEYADSRNADVLVIKIKSSDKPLDLKRMSFPLMHTAFFRVIGFDWYSRFPQGRYRVGYGHAFGYEFERTLDEFFKKLFGPNATYISGSNILKRNVDYIKGVLSNDNYKE